MHCNSCGTHFFVEYEDHPSSEVNYCPYCGELHQQVEDYRDSYDEVEEYE